MKTIVINAGPKRRDINAQLANLQMKVQSQSVRKLNMSIYIRLIYVAVVLVLYVKTMRKSVNASGGMSCPH